MNGVYIDDERVKPDVVVPLQNGNIICFGVNTESNDLKYNFVCQEPNTAMLKRRVEEEEIVKSSPSPPLLKHKRGLSEDQRTKTEHLAPKKKPRLSDEKDKTGASVKIKGRGSLENATVDRDCVTPKKRETCILSILTSANEETTGLNISPAVSVTSSKPSPALSIASTKSDIDELFEGGKTKCTTAILDEAIFGESSRGGKCSKVLKEHRGLDATSLQVQLAKDQMEKEKHKLLSSIEALRSELAAKDQLLAEKDEKTKAAEDIGNSVMFSMQEEFTCVICQELFINAYTLPCAHSFCEWCIKEWMKRKGHKDCPICRKKITSDPVHSLALDNAVSKLVEKLSVDEQKERKEMEVQHKNSLEGLSPAKKVAKRASAATAATSSRMSTRSSVASVLAAAGSSVTSALARAGITVSSPSSSHIVIDLSESPRRTTPGHPIRVDPSTESESDSDSDDSDDSDSEESSELSVSGVGGAYYGGYGRCFNCGKLFRLSLTHYFYNYYALCIHNYYFSVSGQRGHWARGCPY